MLKSFFLAPLAMIYGLIIDFRHKLFDSHLLKSEEFDIPIVSVGNLTVGGTGKTPVTEYLAEQLSLNYNVAVLSRGYKRKSKGFVLCETSSLIRSVGDEPKQIKLKYPEVTVAVCEKRVEGIRRLRELNPNINLIILDDAFQHRYVEPWVNIVLVDYNNPIYRDKLLPWGRLRDRVSQMYRANIVLMTKCPVQINPLDMRIARNSLQLFPYQSLFFSYMKQSLITPLFEDVAVKQIKLGDNIFLLSGIANHTSFRNSLIKRYKIVGEISFEDHHVYRMSDIERLRNMLAKLPADTVIVTTEKDAVKLTNRKKIPVDIQRLLYYIPIQLAFLGDAEQNFLQQVERYVKQNQKYGLLHS